MRTQTPASALARPMGQAPRLFPLLAAAVGATLALAGAAKAWAQDGPQAPLPTTELRAGMHLIRAELAVAPHEQSMGLMFRRDLPGNNGMLFVNEVAGVRCFWMRNTLVPLTIAFIADDGSIVNLEDMQPQTETSHCSQKPVRFALEMKQGWFAKRGLKAGSKITGRPITP